MTAQPAASFRPKKSPISFLCQGILEEKLITTRFMLSKILKLFEQSGWKLKNILLIGIYPNYSRAV